MENENFRKTKWHNETFIKKEKNGELDNNLKTNGGLKRRNRL